MKTLSFTSEEEKELLILLPQKYHDRIKNSSSFYVPTRETLNFKLYWPGNPPQQYKLIDNGNLPSGVEFIHVTGNCPCVD